MKILHGDSLEVLKTLEDESVDLLCTDPPYGYSFMGKAWDKALPDIGIFKECLRVLKPGAFAFVMSAPRSDVCARMMLLLEDAGFNIGFTPIYWTYASGFPKASNVGKQTGVEELKGAYGGFQPKPALEVIIVAMKPLSEKTFVGQALKNGKGITWLDDCRVGTDGARFNGRKVDSDIYGKYGTAKAPEIYDKGRFPANLLVSDDVLNDGVERKSGKPQGVRNTDGGYGGAYGTIPVTGFGDSGSYSRFFSLDAWAQTLPFLLVPKASKREKNEGLEEQPSRTSQLNSGGIGRKISVEKRIAANGENAPTVKNHHPTVKPLKLMSYLITLGSRPGDVVLDPFLGSGTTAIAAHNLGRECIGIEREKEYVEIAEARVAAIKPTLL